MNEADGIVRTYSSLSQDELVQHVRFCGNALASNASVTVTFTNDAEWVSIRKRTFKTKTACLELQISAGHFGYPIIQQMSAVLEQKGFEVKRRLTKKRKILSKVITVHDIENVFTPKVIVDIIVHLQNMVGVSANNFTITYWGQFKEGYSVGEYDPVEFTKAFKIGRAHGRFLATVARLFKRRNDEEHTDNH